MKLLTALTVGLALVGALSAAPARAQNRAFVAAGGSDTNPCSFTAPCRSLQHAHDTVSANGEIDVLDPAGYGTVMINRAININGHGYAEILVGSNGTGITINGNTGAVSLSGLIIDGQGAGNLGIQFNTGTSLTVDNCVIRNLNGTGIYVSPTGSVAATFNHVEVSNTGGIGIEVFGGATPGTSAIYATVTESVATGNAGIGFMAFTGMSNAPTTLMVSHSVSANNGTGVEAFGTGAIIFLANSTVTGNVNGWEAQDGGVLNSYGDNYIDGNPNNTAAPPKIPPK